MNTHSSHLRLLGLFFSLGLFSQIAQALLVREFLVVFYGNEISIGAFYGGWLLWIGLGALWAIQHHNTFSIPTLTLSLPILLAGQMITLRLIRLFWETPTGEFLPLGTLITAALILTAPTGFIIGFLFPVACKQLSHTKTITGIYIMESLGALAGAVLFVFWLVDHLGTWPSLGFTSCWLGLTTLLLQNDTSPSASVPIPALEKPPGEAVNRLPRPLHPFFSIFLHQKKSLLLILIGLLLWLSPMGTHITLLMEQIRFKTIHPSLNLLAAIETRFGHTSLGQRGQQISVISNGRIGVSFPNPSRITTDAAFFYSQANQPRHILLFGGVTDGLAGELLRYPPVQQIDAVEEDQQAFQLIQSHLPDNLRQAITDPRLHIHFEDGRALVNNLNQQHYDLVMILTGDPSSARMNRFFTQEFYDRLRRAMTPNGVLCTRVAAASNYLGREVQSYSGATWFTLQSLFDRVMVVPGDHHTFCASSNTGPVTSDPNTLAERLEITHPTGFIPPTGLFQQLLPPAQTSLVQQRLNEEEKSVNTDSNPVTFFLNMLLWGKFTASGMNDFLHLIRRMGPWPYLIPVMVFSALFMTSRPQPDHLPNHTRLGAAFTLGILGFIAMAIQIMILLGFQSRVGHVFTHLALLNGLFMAGLAAGAAMTHRQLSPHTPLPRLFASIMTLTALFCWSFAPIISWSMSLNTLHAQILFFMLAALSGLLAGTGFPIAVALASQTTPLTPLSGGLTNAADHLGGALGGLVAAGLLLPVLGMTGTGNLLALMALLALPPLFPWPLPLAHLRFLKARQRPSFPFPNLNRTLWFLLLTALLLGAIARQTAPGPRTSFEETQLTQVSGSIQFQRQENPFPFYLGQGPSTPTVSMASMPVAPNVRGYAGPLNLLISVDQSGILRGVRLIHSQETPAYIRGIDEWLASLRGHNFNSGPLRMNSLLDGLSGASITSRAAMETINQTAQAGFQAGFNLSLNLTRTNQNHSLLNTLLRPEALTAGILLLLAIPVYLRGTTRARLWLMSTSLLTLGLLHNSLLTELDLIHLALGRFPSWEGRPAWGLLIFTVPLLGLLWGPIYCSLLCPFGALQELFAKLGQALNLTRLPAQATESKARYLKYTLLATTFAMAWLTENTSWLSFNPMQGLFSNHLEPMLWGVVACVAMASLIYFRFWCRYWCPLGAFFALFNKFALLESIAPKRRFNLCDLGVTHPFDTDCIRCNRCLHTPHPPIRGNSRLLAAFMAVVALLLVLHGSTLQEIPPDSGGWRRVPTDAIKTRIGTGRLSDHEAQWYQSIPAP
ncbi:MAG: 4Fe-4S binding protein [Magnetococcus sp. YQC-5]